jgi:hypothetical protein
VGVETVRGGGGLPGVLSHSLALPAACHGAGYKMAMGEGKGGSKRAGDGITCMCGACVHTFTSGRGGGTLPHKPKPPGLGFVF